MKLPLKLLQILIFLSIALPTWAGEIDVLKNQIDQKGAQIKELQEKEKEYKGAVNEAYEAAETLKELIADFRAKIEGVEDDIAVKRREISSVSLTIRQKELEIQAKEEGIKRTRAYIGAALREIYEQGSEETVELLFKYESFSDFFNQVEYRNLLQEDLELRLDDLVNFKQKLESEKTVLDARRKELKELEDELENKNRILTVGREKKEAVLTETKNEEWRYKNLLKDVRAKQEAIQREIFELEDKLRQAIDAASIPAPRKGVLSWPSEGVLSQFYGCTKFAKSSKAYPSCFHNGIDIAAAYGTKVLSAREGTVLAVENAPYAYGKWIAIEHDNGLVTLYAHLSLQKAAVGQQVRAGELVGYMGSTGYSTGSHLHFSVYAPKTFATKQSLFAGLLPIGATLDPFDYLP
jgi:murein DD-endopeptidase MepM/ murein hydrolase activator NlpD